MQVRPAWRTGDAEGCNLGARVPSASRSCSSFLFQYSVSSSCCGSIKLSRTMHFGRSCSTLSVTSVSHVFSAVWWQEYLASVTKGA